MAKIQIRRDAGLTWATVDPILAEGELGLELDSNQVKVGDGVRTWNQLPYIFFNDGDGGGGTVDPNVLKRGDNVSELFNDAEYISIGDEIDNIKVNGAIFNGDVAFNSNLNSPGVLFNFNSSSFRFNDYHPIEFGTDEIDMMVYSGLFNELSGVHVRGGSGLNTTLHRWGSTNVLSALNGDPIAKFVDGKSDAENNSGRVELYWQDGNTDISEVRVETTQDGVDITGTLSVDGILTDDSINSNTGHFYFNNASDEQHIGWTQGAGVIRQFSQQLSIVGGDPAEPMAVFNVDGSVDLFFNGTKKFETTDLGIEVDGGVNATSVISNTFYSRTYSSFVNGYITVGSFGGNEITLDSYLYYTGGSPGTSGGKITFENTSGGKHTISSPWTSGSDINFRLPDGEGANGQVLTARANGSTEWADAPAGGGGGGTTPSSDTLVDVLTRGNTTSGQDITFGASDTATFETASNNNFQIYGLADQEAYIVHVQNNGAGGAGDLNIVAKNGLHVYGGTDKVDTNKGLEVKSGSATLLYQGEEKLKTNENGVTVTDILNISPSTTLPSTGTSGDLVNVAGTLYHHDGGGFREVYLYNRPASPTDPDNDWDKVVLRVPFDTDLNDVKAGIYGSPIQTIESTFTEAPNKFGDGACRLASNKLTYIDSSLNIFNGEWTIEFWIDLDTWAASNTDIFTIGDVKVQRSYDDNTGVYSIFYLNPNHSADAEILLTSSMASAFSGWKHFALTRNGLGQITFFWDGGFYKQFTDVDIISGQADIEFGDVSGTFFIDDLRISNFNRYPQAFTPPTSALPVFGLQNTPGGPDVNFSDYVFRAPFDTDFEDVITETVSQTGTPEINSVITKYGTGSLRLRGYTIEESLFYSDTNVILPADFTIEFWMLLWSMTNSSSKRTIIDNTYKDSSTLNEAETGQFEFSVIPFENGVSQVHFGFIERVDETSIRFNDYSLGAPMTGEWHHIAVTREDTKIRMYMDGTKRQEIITDLNFAENTTHPRRISIARPSVRFGAGSGTTRDPFDGYLDDFRIMNRAAYTGDTYQTPTAPHPVE